MALSACTSARPQVKVIAMSQAQRANKAREILVYMEVVNPTKRDLDLSRLEYHLAADAWFESVGTVRLGRRVAAKSSTVVEISVPVALLEGRATPAVPYRLKGRLFARADHVERSWKVDASGELQGRAATFRVPGTGQRVGTTAQP